MRADGTAANKAAATGPDTDATKCMSRSKHNTETFSAGDVIMVSDQGGVYIGQLQPPSSGSAGNPILYYPSGYPEFSGNPTYSMFNGGRSYLSFFGIKFNTKYLYHSSVNVHHIIYNWCIMTGNTVDNYSVYSEAGASFTLNNCVVHGNKNHGLYIGAGGAVVVARNTLIYGNYINGVYLAAGSTFDYDYCLITGNNTAPALNMNLLGTVIDGGHNIVESAPRIRSYKANTAYFCITFDDTDTPHWNNVAAALAPYGVKFTCNLITNSNEFNAPKQAHVLALHNAGHDIAIHGHSHSIMTATTAFTVTTTNANPTINVDVAGHRIVLSTTTPGNSVTLDWAADKIISDLQAAVVGKGWTITPSSNVQTALLLSSLADSAGAQAAPYTANLDRSAPDYKFFYNEIAYSQSILQGITGVIPVSYSFPFATWDSGTAAYLKDIAGMSCGRGDGIENATTLLSSINAYRIYTLDINAIKGDGTEPTIRKLAHYMFVRAMDSGRILAFLGHTAADMTVQQWTWFVDELISLGAVFSTFKDAVAAIKADHDTADGITYTTTYPDVSNYRLRSGSPAINAGVNVGLTTDYYGNPIPDGGAPDIGVHEYTRQQNGKIASSYALGRVG